MEKVLQFLEDLSKNNNRDWFNENRDRYEECRDTFLFFTEVLISEIRKFDNEIPVLNPKDCVFRIFRDVRFSKDKRPYKTNFGTFIAKGGRKSIFPGYYFHIQPGASFAGGGVYMPPSESLRTIRNYIAENPEEFLKITEDKEFRKFYPVLYNDQLKTAPMGFPRDHEFMHLLKYKSYVFSTNISDEFIKGDKLVDYTMEAFKVLHRFNSYLYHAVDNFT